MKIYAGSRLDEWATPQDFVNELNLIDYFDVCSSEDNHKFPDYWTIEDNALSQSWPQKCWMNPPFSQAKVFFQKASQEAQKGSEIVAIYKASNLETETWQRWIFPYARAVLFLNKRLNYGNSKNVPFGSALIYYNRMPAHEHYRIGYVVELTTTLEF